MQLRDHDGTRVQGTLEAVMPDAGRVRLAKLVAAMSLATDLGLGQPMEHVVRSCLVGLRLAELLGLEEADRASHIENIYSKIGCSTRAAASLYAMQHGLLPAAPH